MRRINVSGLLVVVAVSAGAMALSPTVAQAAGSSPFVAIIDAGSSGSRIALFAPGTTPNAVPKQLFTAKPKVPALSTFGSQPMDAGVQGVTPLLTDLDTYLAEHKIARSSVKVSLLATAGMRLLEQSNPNAADEVFVSSRNAISQAGFPVGAVKVITGSDEAAYSWVDANATTGTLNQKAPRTAIAEVGGASAQVAFLSNKPKGPGVHIVKVGKKSFPVVALSYLGLGVNEARTSMTKLAGAGRECFPNTSAGKQPVAYVAGTGIQIDAAASNFQQSECKIAFDGVVGSVGADAVNSSTTGGIRPSVVRTLPGFNQAKFIGVSAVSFSMNDFGVTSTTDAAALLESKVNATCSGTDAWTKVVALYGGKADGFTQTACANATYINAYVFGSQGLGVQSARFRPTSATPEDEPSWSRGYALMMLNAGKK